ncbi:MAG: hypothetical protein AAF846_27715 [Chloroflexota bacterium]
MIEKRKPINETFIRLTALNQTLFADVGALTIGFIKVSELSNAEAVPFLHQTLRVQATNQPTSEPFQLVSLFVSDYIWIVSSVAIGTYLLEHRIPDLSAENMALKLNDDLCSQTAEQISVRFLSGRFSCLPDDPCADHPDAIVLPDKKALLSWMRDNLTLHLKSILHQTLSWAKSRQKVPHTLADIDDLEYFKHFKHDVLGEDISQNITSPVVNLLQKHRESAL